MRQKQGGNAKEIWKDIPGYEGIFQVSNVGRVRSLPRDNIRTQPNGTIVRQKNNGRILKQGTQKKGYKTIRLNVQGKATPFQVHRLVLFAFVGPCPKGMEARHFPDNNRANNRLENLQWGTPKENQADRIIHGTDNKTIKRFLRKGSQHPNSKLTENDIPQIRQRINAGMSYLKIAREFGVDAAIIGSIKRGKTWKHVR